MEFFFFYWISNAINLVQLLPQSTDAFAIGVVAEYRLKFIIRRKKKYSSSQMIIQMSLRISCLLLFLMFPSFEIE